LLRRWLKSTSNRTFVLWPALLLLARALIDGGWPRFNPWGLPLMAWGLAQYWGVGRLRSARGGGGPGLANPPERLVTTGPYRFTRNPMYLGHLIFLMGLGVALSWPAWLVFLGHCVWFDRRVRGDEAHLALLFGEAYRDYTTRVRRWVPGIY
jgi:protein-S-isoprenylcysteine O-methyltransferase Ste14